VGREGGLCTRKVHPQRAQRGKTASVSQHAREKKSADKVKDAATKMQQQRRSNNDTETMMIVLFVVGLTYQLKLINSKRVSIRRCQQRVLINKRLSIDGAYQQLVGSR
jgi:hypothetical protein